MTVPQGGPASGRVPVVYPYQQALDEFRRAGEESPLLKRMSELISLLDLTTTLNSALTRDEILDAALLMVLGELQVTRGALFVRGEAGAYAVRAARGVPKDSVLPAGAGAVAEPLLRGAGAGGELLDAHGLEVLCPILKSGQAIAFLGLGPRAGGRAFGPDEVGFLRSVAACAATPIENGLIYGELRQVNQRLSVKVFQLHNLFEISRELLSSFDEEGIKNLVTTTLMGHLLVSRCALYLRAPEGLVLAHERGLRVDPVGEAHVPEEEARAVLGALAEPRPIAELPDVPLVRRLRDARLTLAVPMALTGQVEGFLAVGDRLSGEPFSAEDRDFAQTLARQALSALENVRFHRMAVEKQRRDREMQIAREIQQSLFPACCPSVRGFELAATSQPCYEVGGDHYDVIPLEGGRLALAIADVSGKGTPASILMASVHASLRALAGTAPPALLVERLNRFLHESTQENRYVTLVYAELDPESRKLLYVNCGHVPPFLVRGDGRRERLTCGGTVVGLLEDAHFESGEVELRSGDVVAMVTDGATEALSPDEEEFGDDRVADLLGGPPAGSEELLARLVRGASAWTGSRGCTDDLTALVLRAL
jgi:sigma-B regulation protein RsbU (phosphoserine phosphatase)